MLDIGKFKQVYFVGIGGIGMSSLARWCMHHGLAVFGYDKTPSPLISELIAEGATITFDEAVAAIPAEVTAAMAATLVVRTPAVPASHEGLRHFEQAGYTIIKRAQLLGMLARPYKTIGIAGTHGKTTTSCMLAHVLKHAGVPVTAFLGGVPANYGTNFLSSEGNPADTVVVVEADEFDRSFLQLSPDMAVITSIDADHLDIYGDEKEFVAGFKAFMQCIRPNGRLLLSPTVKTHAVSLADGVSIQHYSLNSPNAVQSYNLRVQGHTNVFDLNLNGLEVKDVQLHMPGPHNVLNATAVAGIAQALGLSAVEIKQGLESFKGVKRRFEYRVATADKVYIDDYAHHPTEIQAFVQAVKSLYPGKKLTVIFQPHLFSRTRDFIDGFAEALSQVDQLVLMPIYPAREQPIPGVTSDWLLEKITTNKCLLPASEILSWLPTQEIEVLATVGAGDIDRLVEPITQLYN